jgi:superfamily I DNA and/or RNA helicase
MAIPAVQLKKYHTHYNALDNNLFNIYMVEKMEPRSICMKKILLLVMLALFVVSFTAPVWASLQGINSPIMDGPPGDPK